MQANPLLKKKEEEWMQGEGGGAGRRGSREGKYDWTGKKIIK